jgi:hypothetical protein
MRPIFIGKDEDGHPIHLGDRELETHVHGIGASRTGKSKLIEWIARELVRNRQGFCLIDPHGFLYNDLVRWLAYVRPNRDIILFEPAAEDRIVGFNPFQKKEQGAGSLGALVDRRVQATVKAWGATSTDETPRLERWLRCLYWALMERGYSLDFARYFLLWQEKKVREYLIRAIRSDTVRSEWQELASIGKLQDFWNQIESTKNRLLFRFVEPQQIKRTMGLGFNNIDLEEVVARGKILLVNLQPRQHQLSRENARVIGTLLLSELWEIASQRQQTGAGKPPSPFFLMIDEFQLFLTPDVPEMLDQAAKYGLHLLLFHQHLSQLKRIDLDAYGAMANARVKLVFGGLQREDARTLAEEIFPGQIDLKRVKFLIEQTKFWPVYARDTIYTRGTARGMAHGTGAGETWNPALDEWVPSTMETALETSSEQEGQADIPIFMPVPFKEVSSITPYSLEESLWELSDRLMEQYQRHFMVRIPGRPTRAAVTPHVEPRFVRAERIAAYRDKACAGFLRAAEVDEALLKIHNQLSMEATGRPLQTDAAPTLPEVPDEEPEWGS